MSRLDFGRDSRAWRLELRNESSRSIATADWVPMELLARYKFEGLVAAAIDDLPDELLPVLDNVVIQVHDRHPDEPDLLGLYEGTPHTDRVGDEAPDVISIYRAALCDMCDDLDELHEEIYVTVIHEIAHAAGIDDDQLHEMGWG